VEKACYFPKLTETFCNNKAAGNQHEYIKVIMA